jgi:replicative DNA helicase
MRDHIPPNNLDAEQAALGSMMLKPEALQAGLEILQPTDFYREAHDNIFRALAELARRKEPVDPITLKDELKRREKLEESGGMEYLLAVVDSVPTAANVEHYARIVAQCAESRRVIAACTELLGTCYDPQTENAADLFVAKALATADRRVVEFFPISEIVNTVAEQIEREHTGDRREGIAYGVPALTRITYGVEHWDSEFTLIAGRPSNGKTVILNEIAVNAAEAGVTVAYYSQETSKTKLVRRMVFSKARVEPSQFRRQEYPTDEAASAAWTKVVNSQGELFNLGSRIIVCDRRLPLAQLVPSARRVVLRHKVGLILVDYLQIVKPDYQRADNQNTAIARVAEELKALAMDTGIPVVAASQLSRPPKGAAHYKATSADLRDSGGLEQEADKVVIIDNPPEGAVEGQPRPTVFRVSKHRDGPTGEAKAWFVPGRFLPEEAHHAPEVIDEDTPVGYWQD